MTTKPRTLWYFADPMCSWCWGFAPVLSAIMDTYEDRLQLALMMGGLRPGTTQPMPAPMRAEILHHWEEVRRRSGQPFRFDGALPVGFVYDTEPACRAVVAMLELDRAAAFPYFKSIQSAFYAEGKDVTQPAV
ncbi:MAG TPA: DsbA family protein, partial [Burkholderiales bacterium]